MDDTFGDLEDDEPDLPDLPDPFVLRALFPRVAVDAVEVEVAEDLDES